MEPVDTEVVPLTPAENERLAILEEEMGESLQIIGKIRRHGFESWDPTKTDSPTNRQMLEKELGDVQAALELMVKAKDLDGRIITLRMKRKWQKLLRYIHYNADLLDQLLHPNQGTG